MFKITKKIQNNYLDWNKIYFTKKAHKNALNDKKHKKDSVRWFWNDMFYTR